MSEYLDKPARSVAEVHLRREIGDLRREIAVRVAAAEYQSTEYWAELISMYNRLAVLYRRMKQIEACTISERTTPCA